MTDSCFCCQKPLEAGHRYHPRCLSRLFGGRLLPSIPFGRAEMPALVARAQGRMSISGVQMKLSARLDKGTGRLESAAAGGTHILKPEPERFPFIPRNENLCMNMAEEAGFPVPPHGLFAMADKSLCYVVKRFDRTDDGTKIQKETMFQILGATEKYAGSLEMVGKAIRSHVANVGLDTIDFFERVLFCFLTGNGDMHLKNWALLYHGKDLSLAPCYDLVCSRVYIPNEDDSALTVNGKKNKLTRADFSALADSLGIDPKASANSFDKLRLAQEKLREMASSSELPFGLRQKLSHIIKTRYERLYGKDAA
ncbi:MAG: HipA domain-containing protein [Elusimicrobia bacterium]|nr:HipA domain-containing protein [Elusimicrobiota bacterium]